MTDKEKQIEKLDWEKIITLFYSDGSTGTMATSHYHQAIFEKLNEIIDYINSKQ